MDKPSHAPTDVVDIGTLVVPGTATRVRSDNALSVVWVPGVYERWLKRPLDVLIAAMLLVLLSPILLLAMALVWLSLGPPLFFVQERIGRGGQPFRMLKLRTMLPCRRRSSEPFDGPDRRRNHKSEDDPRHVPLGRFLRASSIDEIPQLINVIRGDMSLVGPRPELVEIVESYEPWQHRRHVVRPGLTGLWQVTERGRREMQACVRTDLRYVDSLGPTQDLWIMLRTPLAVLGLRKGQ